MFWKNLKISIFLLVVLVLVGVIGLAIAMVEFDSQYREKTRSLDALSVEFSILQNRLGLIQDKMREYDFLTFKADVFERSDPNLYRISESVYRKSYQYGFRPELVLGIVKVESDYNPRAVSNRGAYGLMQVNFSVWKKELAIDKKQIFDVDYNLDLGLQILKRYYLESKGNIGRALHLYNNGYKYNNLNYVTKVKSELENFSLTIPLTTLNSENPGGDLYGYDLLAREDK